MYNFLLQPDSILRVFLEFSFVKKETDFLKL